MPKGHVQGLLRLVQLLINKYGEIPLKWNECPHYYTLPVFQEKHVGHKAPILTKSSEAQQGHEEGIIPFAVISTTCPLIGPYVPVWVVQVVHQTYSQT